MALPILGDLLDFRADPLGFLTRVARQQGDVGQVRLGPYRTWVLNHPDHVRDILMRHPDLFHKGTVLQRARVVLGDGLLTSEGETHRHARDLIQPGFHGRQIATYVPTMLDAARTTTERWRVDEPIDVHQEMVHLTLSTASASLLGEKADTEVVGAAVADLLSAYKLVFHPLGRLGQAIPTRSVRRLRRGKRILYRLVDEMLASGRPSVLSHAGELPAQQIREHAITLLLAGHETTANALAFAFHLLADSPEVEQKLYAEVDAVDDDGDRTSDRLPYTRAVLSEALRLYPPSWSMSRQAIADHEFVRTGDLVILPQWVVHRDPRWWDGPDEFRPERWMDGSAGDRPRWAYFPFGAGIRRCIGEGFAWTEGVLALAEIAKGWRLRPMPGRPVALQPRITLRPKDGVWLRPLPRQAVGHRGR